MFFSLRVSNRRKAQTQGVGLNIYLIILAILPSLALAFHIGIRAGSRIGFTQYDQTALSYKLMEKQLILLQEQHRLNLEDQRHQRFEAHTETAYKSLAQWLHSLRQAIDLIQDGCQGDTQDIDRAFLQLNSWPWDTLRAPTQIAMHEAYWSPEVWYQLNRFQELSVQFSFNARCALRARIQHIEEEPDAIYWFPRELERLEESCSSLRKALDAIRNQSRRDLRDGFESPTPSTASS